MKLSKASRKKLREMFGGKCAYCGKPLSVLFHADHVAPIYRGRCDDEKPETAGKDTKENLFPSCPRCNNRKSTLSIEDFREHIRLQKERLRRDSSSFRLAEDFGIIKETDTPVVFFFEKFCDKHTEV